ncbi:MAG: site-specific DNA-methyltransferase [Haloarculaceae archaeon]
MRTTHEVVVGDARDLALPDSSVDLVVTSPPYPMIEMWDEGFAALDPAVADALAAGDGDRAFERMHALLDPVWRELARVLVDGGVAVVDVGDATRKVGDRFAMYPNGARVTDAFRECGFDVLPDVVWHKPTNAASKFMGSGMLPPNAYVTLEHERLLVFRNGGRRAFEPHADRRYEAAYFWEERNAWFSDVWEVTGTDQALDAETRGRSGAFPVEIPFRLVNMYSTYGDRVLDPFWGTGTTTLAALVAGRHSVGYELDGDLLAAFEDRLPDLPARSRDRQRQRLRDHEAFVDRRRAEGDPPAYEAENYDFPVVTRQEQALRLYAVESVERTEPADGVLPGADRRYEATHAPL